MKKIKKNDVGNHIVSESVFLLFFGDLGLDFGGFGVVLGCQKTGN